MIGCGDSMRCDKGFTLVELLVTIAIVGLLAAIAIPQYAEYRRRGLDSRSLTDLRNAAVAEEAYFVATEHYVDCVGGNTCQTILAGFKWSPNVDIAMDQIAAAGTVPEYFTGRTFHSGGAHFDLGTSLVWNSQLGGLQ